MNDLTPKQRAFVEELAADAQSYHEPTVFKFKNRIIVRWRDCSVVEKEISDQITLMYAAHGEKEVVGLIIDGEIVEIP